MVVERVVVLVPAERHRRLQTGVPLLQLEVVLDGAREQGRGLNRHSLAPEVGGFGFGAGL
jgi:hypothetical protein